MAHEPLSQRTQKARKGLLTFAVAIILMVYFDVSIKAVSTIGLGFNFSEYLLPAFLLIGLVYLLISFSLFVKDDLNNPELRTAESERDRLDSESDEKLFEGISNIKKLNSANWLENNASDRDPIVHFDDLVTESILSKTFLEEKFENFFLFYDPHQEPVKIGNNLKGRLDLTSIRIHFEDYFEAKQNLKDAVVNSNQYAIVKKWRDRWDFNMPFYVSIFAFVSWFGVFIPNEQEKNITENTPEYVIDLNLNVSLDSITLQNDVKIKVNSDSLAIEENK
ncbi:hypothetical protein N7E81_15115 [Reichenbachiella carrageenanivorans]|uniref:Uncharacterized protein n=1 Tax=Reichenbachiella carrageenanivorans TaxID=2979869 RepID=A0ABY6CZ88_9BACT|nr:hypothetical protein [Reichenbachiella carrageenanivorans]UXX78690.1 hypothetical protein N7E81_15115 [Reichenbachiella carrageenanivorans]